MKYVITGGPCSGKSTTLEELAKRGFKVVPETAREVVAEWQKKARPIHDEFYEFQEEIYNRQIAKETAIEHSQDINFVDRGWIDNQTYCQHYTGVVPQKFLNAPVSRYEHVFILDRLPLVNDKERLENEYVASSLHNLLLPAYIKSGYAPITVPMMKLQDRVDVIMAHVKNIELVGK